MHAKENKKKWQKWLCDNKKLMISMDAERHTNLMCIDFSPLVSRLNDHCAIVLSKLFDYVLLNMTIYG